MKKLLALFVSVVALMSVFVASAIAATTGVGFSNPLKPLLPPGGYETCPIGIFDGSTVGLEHHWAYRSVTGGSVTFEFNAISVSPGDAGFQIRLLANDFGTHSIALHDGVPGSKVPNTLTVGPLTAGVQYFLTVYSEAASTSTTGHGGHHYSIGVKGPGADNVELGYGNPALDFLEPGNNRLAFHAAPGEDVVLELSVPTGEGHPASPFSITYAVIDSTGGPAPVPATTDVLDAGDIRTMTFTNTSAAVKTYIFTTRFVPPGGHFTLDKTSGPDEGIYALQCVGPRQVSMDIEQEALNAEKMGAIKTTLFSGPGFDATQMDPALMLLAGAPVRVKGNQAYQVKVQDIDNDGLDDLVLYFDGSALGFNSGQDPDNYSVDLVAFGRLGRAHTGADNVRVVGLNSGNDPDN